MEEGKSLKASDYFKAKQAFVEGISLADKLIDEYQMWQIPGMRKAEHRVLILGTIIITFVVTIVAMYLFQIDWGSLFSQFIDMIKSLFS